MGKTFNLAATFGEALRAVPNSGTERKQIEYIDEALISGDTRNFYDLPGLEELASTIELVGLQQPILVRPDPDDAGGYIIVSGHRRMAAIRQYLKPEAPDKWAQIPCIVERDDVSPAMQELRLIYANSGNREMSNANKAKQVERVTELLYKLKGEGVSFPGRMRDHVAEACQISKSKLGRLKVINDRLIDDLRPLWDAGKLSEDTAYTIAQADEEYQRALLHYYGKDKISGSTKWWVDSKLERISKMTRRKCTVAKGPCAHVPMMLQWSADNPNLYFACEYNACCADCTHLATCSRACPEMTDKRAQLKAQRKADKAAEAKAAEEHDRPYVELTRTMLQRWDAARQAAGKSVKACYEAGDVFYTKSDETAVADLLAGNKKIDRNTKVPYHYCGSGDFKALIQVAKLLGCSADYLLGLSDELQSGKAVVGELCEAAEAKPVIQWGNGEPPEGVPILTYCMTNAGAVYRAAQRDGDKYVDPGKPSKVLTGLSFSAWLPILPQHVQGVPGAAAWPRWINMKERLPEPKTDVLVCDEDGYIEIDWPVLTDGTVESDASYWMPLPPPPGAEPDVAAVVEPRPVAVGWTESPAVPDHDCTCAVVVELGGSKPGKVYTDKVFSDYHDGAWHWHRTRDNKIDMPVLRWLELPEDAQAKEGKL